jgi:queuine tRNA-ribosyltransferase
MKTKRFLSIPHGRLLLPLFMPDATFGVVRSLDSNDLLGCGIRAVVMNVFHLMQQPGSTIIKALGGLHSFSSWHHPIITDSGGFQAYSLIKKNPKLGSFTNKGIVFRRADLRKIVLTPEKSIQLQLSYGSDILICLDDCTHVDESYDCQQESVTRTIDWAKRCKSEFEQAMEQTKGSKGPRPLLFAVVQGGRSHELRRECANSLLKIGFDGFAYGGYPLDSDGNLLSDTIRFTRDLVPTEFPMLALGVGQPNNVVECLKMGYDLFDSSMPTRDARQGRLYIFERDLSHSSRLRDGNGCSYIYIKDRKHVKTKEPISPECNCSTCRNYSLAYLHHLFKINDHLYFRLATLHNLTFITSLVQTVIR